MLEVICLFFFSHLYRYLQEVGYTDTILDVRSQRVRSLLGLSGSEQNGSVETKNLEQILNGGDSPAKQKGQDLKRYYVCSFANCLWCESYKSSFLSLTSKYIFKAIIGIGLLTTNGTFRKFYLSCGSIIVF